MISKLGNGNNMNNKKTIKTILFASLIAAMILPFSGVDFADAQETNKIPDTKLLDRSSNWATQFNSLEEFEDQDSRFRSYVDSVHPDTPWNKITKKNQIIIYNFDSIAGEKNAGLNALLIDVQNQKNSGTYNPTEAERKFHEWASMIVSNPRLPDVNPKLIEQIVQTYNESANLGHVPLELKKSDGKFWSKVVTDKVCEYNTECDINGPQLTDPICEFVNCAYGDTMSIGHLLSVEIDVNSCWGGSSCTFQDDKWLIGAGSLHIGSGDVHSSTKTVSYVINDVSYYTPYDESHTISGTLERDGDTYNISSSTANNSVTKDSSYYFSGACGGGVPQNCGTYSLTAYAEDVIIVY
jgi:hypothetical protein